MVWILLVCMLLVIAFNIIHFVGKIYDCSKENKNEEPEVNYPNSDRFEFFLSRILTAVIALATGAAIPVWFYFATAHEDEERNFRNQSFVEDAAANFRKRLELKRECHQSYSHREPLTSDECREIREKIKQKIRDEKQHLEALGQKIPGDVEDVKFGRIEWQDEDTYAVTVTLPLGAKRRYYVSMVGTVYKHVESIWL